MSGSPLPAPGAMIVTKPGSGEPAAEMKHHHRRKGSRGSRGSRGSGGKRDRRSDSRQRRKRRDGEPDAVVDGDSSKAGNDAGEDDKGGAAEDPADRGKELSKYDSEEGEEDAGIPYTPGVGAVAGSKREVAEPGDLPCLFNPQTGCPMRGTAGEVYQHMQKCERFYRMLEANDNAFEALQRRVRRSEVNAENARWSARRAEKKLLRLRQVRDEDVAMPGVGFFEPEARIDANGTIRMRDRPPPPTRVMVRRRLTRNIAASWAVLTLLMIACVIVFVSEPQEPAWLPDAAAVAFMLCLMLTMCLFAVYSSRQSLARYIVERSQSA